MDLTNPQSLNRYAYVMNNPTTLIDPMGLQSPGDNCSGKTGASLTDCVIGVYCMANPGQCSTGGPAQDPFNSLLYSVPGVDGGVYLDLNAASLISPSTGPCYYVLANPCGSQLPPGPTIGQAPPPPPPDKRPSCASVLWNGLGQGASPTGEAIEQGTKTGSSALAQSTSIYVAARGLSVPLRSPFVRAFTSLTEGLGAVGEVTPLLFGIADFVEADFPAAKANLTGACQNNFWSMVPSLPIF